MTPKLFKMENKIIQVFISEFKVILGYIIFLFKFQNDSKLNSPLLFILLNFLYLCSFSLYYFYFILFL